MSVDIVRAWKDEQYRMSLTESERANLPVNPAGIVELTDGDLEGVAGGMMESEAVIDVDVSVGKTSCCTYSTAATACCPSST
ncbi:mersacidin/lichenicidin family type 2 lantibiotic [Archangium lipolyticum]|uniref:mersacidin/lichenicidin family type 2 lantibiotic n=1 Tax=Archangium lipolyticum TaxID=2970465 RepID=UPI002149A55C|nr:mersacidin/lichenicidin family type 2 lantibiotic [Archangium lipolyticum]